MSNETLFIICGIVLAVSAVLVSLIGLKSKDFPGKAMPAIVAWFAIFIIGAAVFAIKNGKDEVADRGPEYQQASELREKESNDEALSNSSANKAEEGEEGEAEAGEEGEGGGESQAAAKGPGGTVRLEASPTEIAYTTKSLSSKSGKVTIDFDNPSAIEHNVAIESENGEQIAESPTVMQGKTSVSANLPPGTYHFYCTIPGHREAGMEGTLTVK